MQLQLPRVIRSSFFFNLVITVAVLATTGIVNPVAAQTTVLFDFETSPDGAEIEPQFTDPGSGFVLSHTAGAVRGNTQWANDGFKCIPHNGNGCMRISDLGTGATAVTATVNFSEPVESVSLWAFSFSLPATITPIVEGGGMLAPIALTNAYAQYVISEGGPYIGLLMSAPAVNVFTWDDLEVNLTPAELQRDALLGAETETSNLLAVSPIDGTGAVIGATGIDPFTALAKDPTTGIVYGGGMLLDPPILYTYQTTLEIDSETSPDDIDIVVIDWVTAENSGAVGPADLTYLSIALLAGQDNLYFDIPIIGGVVQPIGGAARVLADIVWEFQHGTSELVQVRNTRGPARNASAGLQYQINDNIDIPTDGLLFLQRYFDGNPAGPGLLAEVTAQDTRLLRIENAPSLYEVDELTGAAIQLGILGTNVISINAADFDASGQLWAAITIDSDGVFEGLATIDKTDGSATLVDGGFGGGLDCIDGISFDTAGTLWGVSSCNDNLYQIRLVDGVADFITHVEVGEGGPVPAAGFTSLQFSCANTLFAGTGQEEDDGGELFTINADSGQASPVGIFSATDGSGLGGLALHTTCGTSIIVETPVGTNVPVVSIISLEQVAAEVVVPGDTRVNVCVGRDARWVDNDGWEFTARTLDVSELSGTGSCTGLIESGSTDTWEADVFPLIDLTVDARFRSYLGEFTIPGDLEPTEDYWMVLAVIRTDAEFGGVVAVEPIPEDLINYLNMPMNETPGCDRSTQWRNVDVGGAVNAFGEFLNVEGDAMIVGTAQCNRPRTLTRRTTHLFPMRIQNFGETNAEQANVAAQLAGISATLAQAAGCANPALIAAMGQALDDAESAFDDGHYANAQVLAEQFARLAKETVTGFDLCPLEANYRGNFIARGLTLAFTFHDRFEHADVFQIYLVPADLEVPLLTPTSVDAPNAPEGLFGRAKGLKVNLSWQASANADTYLVFRRLNSEFGFTEVGEVSGNAFVEYLPTGTLSAEYYVVAENAFGQSGPSSTIVVTPTFRRRR